MSATNEAVARRFYDEVLNKGKVNLIDELATPDFVEHEEIPGIEPNLAGVKMFINAIRTGFPDIKATVNDVISQGDKVVCHVTMRGTHKGTFLDIPATGREINVNAIDIMEFREGKASAHWGVTDNLTMMTQLGIVPARGEPKP